MDKRTILALALVAIVIIVTPKLFPTALPKTPAKTPAAAGAAAGAAAVTGSTGAASATPAPASAQTPQTVEALPTVAAQGAATQDSTGAFRAESTSVSSAASDFLFSNVGAAPLQVRLPSFKALDKVNANVTITAGTGQSILGYRGLGVNDTLSLGKVPVTLERSTASTGASVLT